MGGGGGGQDVSGRVGGTPVGASHFEAWGGGGGGGEGVGGGGPAVAHTCVHGPASLPQLPNKQKPVTSSTVVTTKLPGRLCTCTCT